MSWLPGISQRRAAPAASPLIALSGVYLPNPAEKDGGNPAPPSPQEELRQPWLRQTSGRSPERTWARWTARSAIASSRKTVLPLRRPQRPTIAAYPTTGHRSNESNPTRTYPPPDRYFTTRVSFCTNAARYTNWPEASLVSGTCTGCANLTDDGSVIPIFAVTCAPGCRCTSN
jgi:hypothetical protein